MARFLLCFLIMANANLILTMAESKENLQFKAEAPMARKLGKHNLLHSNFGASKLSPSNEAEENREVSSASGETGAAGPEQVMKTNHRHHNHHHSVDKSIAGGIVILGVLATVFLVAVFCYIRATGRKAVEPCSPTNSSIGIGKKIIAKPGKVENVEEIKILST
ncbi:hypothetical protein ACJIZ3_022077 [Penstemon smallii]|uniref:Transmembrane protein n=1 Tax=Penstemon smallii TaxID=265156 RepID=A0ABD3SP98_9LAMI